MKEQEQRIAIAKWMGLTTYWANGHVIKTLPDYTHDLNAMHEAEMKLTNAQRRRYASMLVDVHPLHYDPRDANGDDKSMNLFLIATMTAAQRAEALLRTLNLWTENAKPNT